MDLSHLSNSDKPAVGIDIGSSALLVAYRSVGDKRISIVKNWPGHVSGYTPVETSITSNLYIPPKGSVVWGHLAERVDRMQGMDPARKIVNWKPACNPGSSARTTLEARASKLGMKAEDFPYILVTNVLNHLFKGPQGVFASELREGKFSFSDIRIVFGKPPAWDLSAFISFLTAAINFGFEESQIGFVSESEASMRGSAFTNPQVFDDLKPGKAFVMGDNGGYTNDFGAYEFLGFEKDAGFEKEKPRLKQVGPLPQTETYGSETIVSDFVEWVKEKLESKGKYEDSELERIVYEVGREFRGSKCGVDVTNTEEVWNCGQIWGIQAAEPSDGLKFLTNGLEISMEVYKRFYDQSINSIISKMSDYIFRCHPTKPEFILFSGGYSLNPYFRKRMIEEFDGNMNIKCKFEEDPKPMVAKGAVDMILNPELTKFQLLKESHCITTVLEWTAWKRDQLPGLDFEEYTEGKLKWFAAYEWLGKMGEEVPINRELNVDTEKMRTRIITDLDQLKWTETITTFKFHPGKLAWSPYSDERFQQPAKQLVLKVDLTPYYDNLRQLQTFNKKLMTAAGTNQSGGKGCDFGISYAIDMRMEGDMAKYGCTFPDPNGKGLLRIDLKILDPDLPTELDKHKFESSNINGYGYMPQVITSDRRPLSGPDDEEPDDPGDQPSTPSPQLLAEMTKNLDIQSTTPEGEPAVYLSGLFNSMPPEDESIPTSNLLNIAEADDSIFEENDTGRVLVQVPGIRAKPRRLRPARRGAPSIHQDGELSANNQPSGALNRDQITARLAAPTLAFKMANRRISTRRTEMELQKDLQSLQIHDSAVGQENRSTPAEPSLGGIGRARRLRSKTVKFEDSD